MVNPVVSTKSTLSGEGEGVEKTQVTWQNYQLSASADTDNIIADHAYGPDPWQINARAKIAPQSQPSMGTPLFARTPVTQVAPVDKDSGVADSGQISGNRVIRKIEELNFCPELIRLIFSLTENNPKYIYFGSLVAFFHGCEVSPSDFDIMCDIWAKNELVDALKRELKSMIHKGKRLKLSDKLLESISEVNIPPLTRLHFTPRNDKENILLPVELCLMEPKLFPGTGDITISSVADDGKDFRLYSVTPEYQLNDMIIKNDNYREIYLVNDYFTNLSHHIERSVLFNSKDGEQSDEQGVLYALLMRALIQANKSKSLFHKYIESNITFINKKDVLEKLKVSIDELVKALKNHPEIDEFKQEINQRLSEKRREETKGFVRSLMALLDTQKPAQSHGIFVESMVTIADRLSPEPAS